MSSETPCRPARLSVIVPAYNETGRIEESLHVIGAHLAGRPDPSEIVLVDDGSTDGTAEHVEEVSRELPVPVRTVRYEPNRGKGYALKRGFAEAQGEQLVFMDADLSVPIEFLDPLLAALEEGADVAIGSRHMPGARIEEHQPMRRQLLGMIFTWLVQAVIAPVSDATCGFKGFRRAAGKDLFAASRIPDWSFDAEILFLARKRGLRVAEVPVSWTHRSGTKVRPVRDGFRSLAGLWRIRTGSLLGAYRVLDPPAAGTASVPARSNEEAET